MTDDTDAETQTDGDGACSRGATASSETVGRTAGPLTGLEWLPECVGP